MAVPPQSSRDVQATFESELRDEPAPRVPKPLPGRERSPLGIAATVAVLALILICVLVLL